MPDLIVRGPDTYRLLEHLGANSFQGFGPGSAKQLITVRPDGQMIGDAILFCVGDHHVRVVGRPPALNWVQFHAETGDWDVTVRRDERTVNSPKGRELFRLQLQGPHAAAIFEKVNGGPMPDIPFFHMGRFKVGPHEVTALNHRMSGFPGYEFTGPYADFASVRDIILEAGEEFGLRQVGARAYASVATESGWIANTLPATYSGDDMKAFRTWRPAGQAYAAAPAFFMTEHFGIDPATLLRVHDVLPPSHVGASATDTAPDMAPFTVMENDDVRVTAVLVPHGAVYPAYAYRFDTDHGSVVLSGDTSPSPNLIRLARHTDVLVHEALHPAGLAGLGLPAALIEHILATHTDVAELGRIAAESDARALVATHLGPGRRTDVPEATWHRLLRDSAHRAGYGGPALVGDDLMRVPVARRRAGAR
ncbi:hypothetical protein ABZ464_38385 [Streptomyces sp. NPDC005820]|uniref:hypothetical protein n=1 Tax=Streptomyces sp. NPDC005820 TaxID=3157069 RepID=UPI0033C7D07A